MSVKFAVHEPINRIWLDAGTLIKDLDSAEISPKHKAYNESMAKAEKEFQAKIATYNDDVKPFKEEAEIAEGALPGARFRQIASIAIFALAVIAVVGLTVAAIVTGTLPLLFAAAPILCIVIVSAFFSFRFTKHIDILKTTIEQYQQYPKPQKANIAPYIPQTDFDYKHSRHQAIQKFNRVRLSELRNHNFTTIVNYRLLENSSRNISQIGLFYGKVSNLIEQAREVDQLYKKGQLNYDEAQTAYGALQKMYLKFKRELYDYSK